MQVAFLISFTFSVSKPTTTWFMPKLLKYKRGSGAYVRASIGGKFVTFQLTINGAEFLKKYGIYPDQNFDLNLLVRLRRKGDAFTHSGAVDLMDVSQDEFDFKESQELDFILPKCEVYGSFDDLDLVVLESGSEKKARILGAKARLQQIDKIILSVPLWILSKFSLAHLEQGGRIPPESPAIIKLHAWFDDDLDSRCSSVKAKTVQESLFLELEGDLIFQRSTELRDS